MTLSRSEIGRLSELLNSARLNARERERLTVEAPHLTLEEAYLIQDDGIAFRLKSGESVAGFKMGLTSEAKRKQMGLTQAIYGVLTDRMEVKDGHYSLKGAIHPKIEPELAFRIKREIRSRLTLEQAAEACESICGALEILDSRYTGFKYFSLNDVVADNASSSHFVLGTARSLTGLDLLKLKLEMVVNGKLVESALSEAISGHPLLSLVQLSELLEQRGKTLPAGSIVLAGAPTQAVSLEPEMQVELRIEGFESVRVRVKGNA